MAFLNSYFLTLVERIVDLNLATFRTWKSYKLHLERRFSSALLKRVIYVILSRVSNKRRNKEGKSEIAYSCVTVTEEARKRVKNMKGKILEPCQKNRLLRWLKI